jgi:UDP-N-acetylmuramate--alanine ligase
LRFRKFKRIHFIGIAGIGMSGIAEILLKHGFQVSGSDLNLTEVSDRLTLLGATVFQGHHPKNIDQAEVVVYSSAVKDTNPELSEARKRKIPTIRRAEMLAELMRMKFGIAIAGTHGKTSTTSMVGAILMRGNLDPTIIVGGISPLFGSNARIGSGEFLVVEADEFDRSFLKLTPTIAVVTNLEPEHLDCYRDLDDLIQAFALFTNQTPFYGSVIVCIDEPGVRKLIPTVERPVITYGLDKKAQIAGVDIRLSENRTSFQAYSYGQKLGLVELAVPGEHNVKNALAAITVGLELEIPWQKINLGLKDFTGVKRRFQILFQDERYIIVDDYAHHHSEVKATLSAAKAGYHKRIIALFQPHLFTRTRDFYREFGPVLKLADIALIAPIYPAREEPLPGISAELIAKSAQDCGHKNALYISDKEKVLDIVLDKIQVGDMVITMGAGDIWKIGRDLCEILKKR